MQKTTWIIISLSIVIIILILIITTGNGSTQAIIDQIREQRIQLIRSTAIIEFENSKIRAESAKLRANYIESEQNNLKTEEDNIRLETENRNYRRIILDIRAGSKETKSYLDEYGRINSDFADFIQQNQPME